MFTYHPAHAIEYYESHFIKPLSPVPTDCENNVIRRINHRIQYEAVENSLVLFIREDNPAEVSSRVRYFKNHFVIYYCIVHKNGVKTLLNLIFNNNLKLVKQYEDINVDNFEVAT